MERCQTEFWSNRCIQFGAKWASQCRGDSRFSSPGGRRMSRWTPNKREVALLSWECLAGGIDVVNQGM